MKTIIPSSPQVQAQTGLNSTPTAAQPLSPKHRPDAGRRGPDPLEYHHRHPSLREYAQVLALRELEGMSYSELASVQQLSIGTVESRLHRARARLKRRLEKHVRRSDSLETG